MKCRRPALMAWIPLLALLVTSPARAQNVAAAEALFNQALADVRAGNYKEACPRFRESYRLDPVPGALFALADCHAKAGEIATAVVRFNEYLRVYDGLTLAQQTKHRERAKKAKDQIAALKPEVPELTLVLPASAPKGTKVTQDGIEISAVSLGIPLPIDPGEHVVLVQAPSGPSVEQRFTIAKGEKKRLELTTQPQPALAAKAPEAPPKTTLTPVLPAAQPTIGGAGAGSPHGASAAAGKPAPPSGAGSAAGKTSPQGPAAARPSTPSDGSGSPEAFASHPDEGPSGQRLGAYVAGGAGLVALGVGIVTGVMTFNKASVVKEECLGNEPGADGTVGCTSQEGIDAAESGKSLSSVSTVGFSVGIAGIATSVVLLLTESKQPSAGRDAGWLRVGITAAGPDGVAAGVRGMW